MFNKGIFNLDNFLELGDNDILSTNINESGEFESNSNAMLNMDTGSSSNVSIPGGDKETPSAKPYDLSSIGIPGGISESPKSRPYDEMNIPVPSGKTITVDTYNKAMSMLKNSFKEACEIIGLMEDAVIVHKTTEELQAEFTETAIGDAILNSIENGPIFEAVKRSDKNEVKDIVAKIRDNMSDDLYDMKIKFYKPNLIARILSTIITAPISVLMPSAYVTSAVSTFNQFWYNRLWQIVGVVLIEDGNISTLSDHLNQQYKSELGDYKLLYQKTSSSLADIFRKKFNWKNNLESYFILVDKKLPIELKQLETMAEKEFKASENGDKKDDGKIKKEAKSKEEDVKDKKDKDKK